MSASRLARNLLAIDIGNSKALAVQWSAGVERARWRIAFAGRTAAWVRRAWVAVLEDVGARLPILVASVAPARTRQLEAALRGRRPERLRIVRSSDAWPFEVAVRNPHTVGVDRLANVAGLRALGWRSGIAVDAGTAITIDVLREGSFEGGLILPGADLMLAALHAHTAQLPRVRVRGPVRLVGRDTPGALQAGVYHPLRFGVGRVLETLLEDLGERAGVAVTGGQAEWFAGLAPDRAHRVPDLTLLGLRFLATRPVPGRVSG